MNFFAGTFQSVRYQGKKNYFVEHLPVILVSTLLKKSIWHRCFPVSFAKFLRTPFLENTSGRLLLSFSTEKSIPLFSLNPRKVFSQLDLDNLLYKNYRSVAEINNHLPLSSLTTIFKSFVRSDLHYSDVIFDNDYDNSYHQSLESPQCKASLAITGALKVLLTRRFI